MKTYSAGEWHFGTLEARIKRIYNIKEPRFIYNFEPFKDRQEIITWADQMIYEDRLIKFKPIDGKTFELKDFSYYCSLELRKKIADEFLKEVEDETLKKFGTTDFMLGIYTKKEAYKELLYSLLEGKSYLMIEDYTIPDIKPNSNRIFYRLSYVDKELDVDIMEGFIELENTY